MTSATKRLRALLDERGVEHYDGIESTLWLKDEHGYRASADEVSGGMMQLVWGASPEQAVAATLGPGTCHAANVAEYAWDDFECSECGWVTWGFIMEHEGCGTVQQPRYCPNCGRRVVE